jgi:hypothetical protein
VTAEPAQYVDSRSTLPSVGCAIDDTGDQKKRQGRSEGWRSNEGVRFVGFNLTALRLGIRHVTRLDVFQASAPTCRICCVSRIWDVVRQCDSTQPPRGRDARAAGFADAADQRAAKEAGVSNAAEWPAQRMAIKARADAQKAEAQAMAIRELKVQARQIDYGSLAREPTKYSGAIVTFQGKVVQAVESGSSVTLRIAVTTGNYGSYVDTVYVDYRKSTPSESRILEGDVVRFWGEFTGIKSYTAVLGNAVQIPHVIARVVERAPPPVNIIGGRPGAGLRGQ